MKFEYENGELDILDTDLPEDDNSMINYCKTLHGHTLMIDPRFELVPTAGKNLYIIRRKK